MGVSAFLMAEFLGRSYFDVVARGYTPGLIYFAGVALRYTCNGKVLAAGPVPH